MHRGGPRLLPPRRAPFGRRTDQPPPGAPTLTAPITDPHSRTSVGCTHLRLLREESRDSRVVARATRPKACDLSHSLGHMPHLLSSGTGAAGSEGAGVRGGRGGKRGETPPGGRPPPPGPLFGPNEGGGGGSPPGPPGAPPGEPFF